MYEYLIYKLPVVNTTKMRYSYRNSTNSNLWYRSLRILQIYISAYMSSSLFYKLQENRKARNVYSSDFHYLYHCILYHIIYK